jgi:hypothetical protein
VLGSNDEASFYDGRKNEHGSGRIASPAGSRNRAVKLLEGGSGFSVNLPGAVGSSPRNRKN